MSESNDQPWLKWENIEKFLGQKIPLAAKEKSQAFLDNMSWVDGYVQEMLKKAMPTADTSITSRNENPIEVFETHEHVIAQIRLPKDEDPRALQVFIKSNQIKLTGFLDGTPRIVKLPAAVLPKTATARYKQRSLQIQIRKRGLKDSYHEVYIRY
ncbi:hypothetical protein D3C73_704570 [compost metagenome]